MTDPAPSRPRRLRHAANPKRSSAAWTLVWQGDSEGAAQIVCGSLNSAGLRAQMRGLSPSYPAPGMLSGGSSWQVWTVAADAERARRLLAERGERSSVVRGDGAGLSADRIATLRVVAGGVLFLVVALVLESLYRRFA